MQHQQLKLQNNLETLFINSPGSTAASIQIWFRAGSALETGNDKGIAHFLEHMFFKGTPSRPGAAIAHEVESLGGEMNAFTSFDYTCYYINSPNEYLPKMVGILLDMISYPEFKNSDIVPERGVVFEEYRRSLDDPGQVSFHKLQTNCFLKGYKHPILGSEKTIKNFSRDQLIKFRKNFYNLTNSLFVVAGDLKEKKKIVSIIEKFKIPTGPRSEFPVFNLSEKATTTIHKKDVKMGRITIAIQGPKYSGELAAGEDLAFNCLGHGETSRLHRALVSDTSLANSTSAYTMFMNNGGVHFIGLAFPMKNFEKVLVSFEKLIKNLIKKGFGKEEIQKIKNQYLSSKIYDRETIESYAFSLGNGFAQTGDIHSEDEFLLKIKKASLGNVNSSICEIFSRPIHIGLQIPDDYPKDKAEKPLKKFSQNLSKLKSEKNRSVTPRNYQKSKFDNQVKIIKLADGINFLYRYNEISPTFVFHGYLKGGLSDETKVTNGSYNLLSSMLTKGYKKVSDKDIQDILELNAASLHGFAGKNAYGVTLHGLTEHGPLLMPLFLNSLLSPDIPEKVLKHEKEMVRRSLDNQDKNPLQQCFQQVSDLMFNDHPYSMNILGTKKTIKSLTRGKLKDLHNKNLKSKDMLITYCGNQSIEEILGIIEPYLKSLKKRPKKKLVSTKLNPIKNKTIKIPFDREQTQIFLGFPIKKLGTMENIYLKMLTTHLSGQSSELFVEVRDKKGLCYTAQPIHMQALEGGYWGIYMASGHDKVDEAVKTLKELLAKIAKNGLSKSEFDRIKTMIQGQDLINIQTNEDFANIYSVPLLQGHGVDFFYKSNEKIKNLKYQEFQKGIKGILGRKMNLVMVGRD
ncbi:MAG: insulinase family protein [Deltaproteobacteria bacterium]|nr:MAG: insulinase family protein [Deltaproteobacteria bacterium]